jgi:N-acetylmuramoyl-L-alanine amidase
VGGNSGNHSSLCIDEQDHNLRVARHLATRLEGAGHSVRHSRSDNRGPAYSTRITQAQAWGAQAIISLHSDARGSLGRWSPEAGLECLWNDANPGFSVLWSDEGAPALVAARLALARDLAARLHQAGFLPYDGYQYSGIYDGDPDHPGVFVDRHEPRRRIRMLRRPGVPSVIIETHNASDRHEEPRWQQEATLEAFDAAVLAALGDWANR